MLGGHASVNIGSDELITITKLAEIIMEIAGKRLSIKTVPGPIGVRGRNSNNELIEKKLGWRPNKPIIEGLKATYAWIEEQVYYEKNKYQMNPCPA